MSAGARANIIVVTASYPVGAGEEFIEDELAALAEIGVGAVVIPVHPRGSTWQPGFARTGATSRVVPVVSGAVCLAACRIALRRPRATLSALATALGAGAHGVRDLAAFPKALWLADQATRLGSDHVHAFWLSAPASVAMAAARVAGVDWSATAHRWDVYGSANALRKGRRAKFVRFISLRGLGDGVGRGIPRHKAVLVHLGARVSAPPAQRPGRGERPTLFCPANLLPVKGHDRIFAALARIPDPDRPRLVLLGDGVLKADLQARAVELGLGRHVEFRGRVSREGVLRAIREDPRPIVILGSRDLGPGEYEGIPFSLIEAMANGVPVIAPATGSIGELLGGQPGLVADGDTEGMAEVIRRFCQDRAAYDMAAEAGWGRVETGWNATLSARMLKDLMVGGG